MALVNMNEWQTRWMAGVVAALGTVFTAGGPVMLAEHYASTGASWNASDYYAQTRSIACVDPRGSPVMLPAARRSAERS